MSTMRRTLVLGAAFAAALALCAAAHALEGAQSVLKQEALDGLGKCVAGGQLASLCVVDAIPSPQEGMKICKLRSCDAAAQKRELGSEQARELLKEIEDAFKSVGDASQSLKAAAAKLQGNAGSRIGALREGRKLDANEWDVDSIGNPAGDPAARSLQAICKQPADSNCIAEAKNLLALRVASHAFGILVQKLNWPEVERSAACSKLLRERYEAYFDESRFQWPWELYINGLPRARGDTPLLCEGFRDVPSQQWIVMHPTVGIRYSENAARKTDAAVIVELIGMRRWRWDGARAVGTRGASLILSYSDQSDAKKVGWGVMVHMSDDVSVGLVRHKSDADNKVSLVLGYEFGKLVGQDRRAACKKLLPDAEAFCDRVDK